MVNTLFLQSAIWCIRVYDDVLAPKLRKAPVIIHDIATQGRGITPVSAPTPLPRKRKRALTNPLLETDIDHGLSYSIRRSRQRNDLQGASLFITKLPEEIRNIIYAEVLCNGEYRLVHILPKDGRLGHWRCRLQMGKEPCASQSRRCIEGWLTYRNEQWSMDHNGRLSPKTDSGLLSLLLTCRVIYTEAISTLYSKNIFHFHDPGDVRHFARTILPQRLNQLQSLVVDWERPYSIFNEFNTIPKRDHKEFELWSKIWAIIQKMESLRYLAVVLKKHKFQVTQERREQMCQPMMAIHGLKIFELRVPHNDTTDWSFATTAPFRVVRLKPRGGQTVDDG